MIEEYDEDSLMNLDLCRTDHGKKTLLRLLKDPSMIALCIGIVAELEERANRILQAISDVPTQVISLHEVDMSQSSTGSMFRDVQSQSYSIGAAEPRKRFRTESSKTSKMDTF